jgi:hypothetical protein
MRRLSARMEAREQAAQQPDTSVPNAHVHYVKRRATV